MRQLSLSQTGGIWWLLGAALLVVPWLIPIHTQPWTFFHGDTAMAIAVLPLALWALVADRSPFRVPLAAIAAGVLAVVPLLQWVMGLIRFAGDAWLAAIYLLGFAAAIVVGARARRLRPSLLPNILFASFGVAAMLSFVLALCQWLRLDWPGLFVFPLPYARPMANLAQPNHLATLLVWGLVALWGSYLAGHLRGALCTVAAGLLLFGIAMTQSRVGGLEVLLLGCAAVVFRGALRTRRNAWVLVLLGMWFLTVFLAWAPLNDVMQLPQAQSLAQRMAPGSRILIWQLLLDAAVQRPWTGWGWNQVVLAQVALASGHPAVHEVFSYSHNLVLDLILWNGLPVALLVCAGLVAWCVKQVRQAVTPERALLLTAVGVFLLHAQFELPHGYLLFLLPVGLMVGALDGGSEYRWHVAVPRVVVALPLVVLVFCLVVVVRDYVRIEEAWMAYRMQAARIGTIEPAPIRQAVVLTNLQALLETVRIEPRRGMPQEEIEKLHLLAEHQPGAGSLFRYAQASALNGGIANASKALDVLCRLHKGAECASAKVSWIAVADKDGLEMLTAWPSAD